MLHGVRRASRSGTPGLPGWIPLRRAVRAEQVPAFQVSPTSSGQGILVSSRAGCAIEIMIPAFWEAALRQRADGAVTSLPEIGESRHCMLFAVDIAQFTRADRDDQVQLALREALYRLLIEAFDHAGIPWESCIHEDRGDGAIVIIPASASASAVVGTLIDQIRERLRTHNRLASRLAQLRLRLALHTGEVHRDRHGFAGEAVNHLFRILDAPALRERLLSPGTEFALIVSDFLYRSAVDGAVTSGAYSEVAVRAKQFHAAAWILTVPG